MINEVKSVLFVDDEKNILKSIRRNFSKNNFNMFFANSGKEALILMAKEKIDLVVSDINMPGMNGFELFEKMKQDDFMNEIPIIFFTGNDSREDVVIGLQAGAVDYVRKPFYPPELLSRINNHLLILKQKDEILENVAENRTLVHILSHDLVNHLSYLRLSLELVEMGDEFNKEKLDLMLRTLDNGFDVINAVREMGKIEVKELNLYKVNLLKVVQNSIEYMREKLNKKNLHIHIDIPPDLEVIAEEIFLVTSVFNNIFTNAIKFSYPDSVISIFHEEKEDSVLICIKDSGIGMPKTLINDLFNIEKKTSRIGTNGEQGTGFGMPLIKKITNGIDYIGYYFLIKFGLIFELIGVVLAISIIGSIYLLRKK